MKNVPALLLALALSSPAALADGLPAGKPAGVHRAQMDMNTGVLVLAGAAVIAVIVAVATSGGSNPAVTTSSAVGATS